MTLATTPSSTNSSGTRRPSSVARSLLVAGSGLTLHMLLARPVYSWSDRVGAWLMLLVLFEAVRRFLRAGANTIPVAPFIAAQVYIFYGLSQFSQEQLFILTGVYTPSPSAVSAAVWLVLIGELVCLGAYDVASRLVVRKNFFDRILPSPSRSWRVATAAYAAPALLVYAAISLRPEFLPVTYRMAISRVFDAYLALGMLLYQGYRHGDRRLLTLGWAMIFVMAAIALAQGVIGTIAFPFIIGFIAARIWGGTARARWVILAVLCVIVLQPAKRRYRQLAWADRDVSSLSQLTERLDFWADAFGSVWGEKDEGDVKGNIMETANRSSDFLSFAQTIDYVPSQIPFNSGNGMETSLIYWIPRFLWPGKPGTSDLINNRWAVDFGYITSEGTKTTTIGASLFTEGYWNFGSVGVILFLGIAGVLLALLLGQTGRAGEASTIAALAYLGNAIQLLQPLSMILPGAVTFAAGVWCAFQLIRVGRHFLRVPIQALGKSNEIADVR